MHWIIISILVIGLILFLTWASADVGSNIYLKVLCRRKTKERIVALTFDDGPDEEWTPRVLQVLKEYDIKATFFLIGKKVDKNPDIVNQMINDGHTIGKHSFSHQGRFPIRSQATIIDELSRCSESIYKVTNRRTTLFRPPFGVTNPTIGKVVKRLGYKTIGWSIRSFDTIKYRSREAVCRRVISKLHPGAIILLHDRCEKSDELLRNIIEIVLERKYRFVSLEELLNIGTYEN